MKKKFTKMLAITALVLLGVGNVSGQTVLFDMDFTAWTGPSSINETSGTASDQTVNGIIFRTRSNKSFDFDASGMTWCDNNLAENYHIRIPLTNINGSITITA